MQTEDNRSLKDSGLNITREFIAESIKHASKEHRKKGGPYSKDRSCRRKEVYRLHFEYGYSAVKIADMMKMNRNTVNNDINYLYLKLEKEWNSYSMDSWWMKQTYRMEMQRTRLLEQLGKEVDFQKRLALEKMIHEIDSKMMHSSIRIITSKQSTIDTALYFLNKYAKDKKLDLTFVTSWDINKLETRNRDKIIQIIKNDKAKRIGKETILS